MRKGSIVALIVIMFALAMTTTGCCCAVRWPFPGLRSSNPMIVGSARLATQQYDISDFVGVEAGGSFRLTIRHAPDYQVSVTANDSVLDYVRVENNGGTLRLSLESGYSYTNVQLTADIAMPAIERLALSGSAKATLEGQWESALFRAKLSGASAFSGSVHSEEMDLEVSGSSIVDLSGSARDLQIKASGASQLDMNDLEAVNANIALSGSSRCNVEVNGSLDANLTGASKLHYAGSPRLGSINASGGSEIRQR